MKTISCCLLSVALAFGQTPPPPAPASTPENPKSAEQKPVQGEALLEEVKKQFQKERIEIDAKAGTLTIPAVVNDPPDPIEYLLIHRKGKRHEAMFWTQTKPSVLNAALLMVGLQPGQNATYTEKQPPPTIEEMEKGADSLIVTPPKGMEFWMTVRWKDGKDADGKDKEVEYCVEDLLLDLGTQEPVADCSWIYLGGRMAKIYRDEPEVYVADFEGNLISVCYLTPDNHLGTMVHANARDDQNWWTTKVLPAPGTDVQFVFHKKRPQIHQDRAARIAKQKAVAPPTNGDAKRSGEAGEKGEKNGKGGG